MIEGVGVDIVSIERIKSVYEKFNIRFLNRVFTAEEIKYSFSHLNPFPHLAARFAVKEAVIKALKKPKGLKLKDIEVVNNLDGSPEVKIDGLNKKIFISLSHERNYTVAFVVV